MKKNNALTLSPFIITFFILSLIVFSVFILSVSIQRSQQIKSSFAVSTGDCDSNGTVSILDFQLLSNSFGKSQGQTGFNVKCDFNTDTVINILDFQILSNNFGKTGETTTPTRAVSPTKTPTSQPTIPVPTSATVNLKPFGTVSIGTSDIKFNVNGAGSNVDSIAFWEAPNSADSLMFVTSKGNSSVEVYKYPFTQQIKTVSCGSSSNGVWVDQDRDILYITQPNTNNVCAYNLPAVTQNSSLSIATNSTKSSIEPNLTLLKLPSGQRRLYVSYDTQVRVHDAVSTSEISSFTPSKGLETMYADNYYQKIYIPDENGRSGVYIYNPDGTSGGTKFGDSTIFDSDEEGIWVYKCPSTGSSDNGDGLIVVSDQKSAITDFEFFNRKTKQHLGKINITGVSNTDGISITQQSSLAYPLGLLAVIDDDTSTVGVGWDTILTKTGLTCSN